MSSLCWPRADVQLKRKQEIRRSIYSALAFSAIWGANLLIIFFGWPFLVYGKLKYRKPEPESHLAFQR